MIVQDVDGSSGENESTKTAGAPLIAEPTDYAPDAVDIRGPSNPEASTGLGSSCIVRVVIESSDAVMEEVVPNPGLGHVEAVEGFTVPQVLQQTQLVAEAYESTVDMEGIVENVPERKT